MVREPGFLAAPPEQVVLGPEGEHEVTIREAGPLAGGMMRFGIPKYRLPRDVLDAEIRRILEMGVMGYLTKSCEAAEMIEAVRRVMSGERFLGAEKGHC